jgi:hypothetical protein
MLRAHDRLTAAALAKDAANPEQHVRARDSLLDDGLIARTGRHLHLP